MESALLPPSADPTVAEYPIATEVVFRTIVSFSDYTDVLNGYPGLDNSRDVRQPHILPRHPPHWEDNPYPASSLRDHLFRDHNYHCHHCCSPGSGF